MASSFLLEQLAIPQLPKEVVNVDCFNVANTPVNRVERDDYQSAGGVFLAKSFQSFQMLWQHLFGRFYLNGYLCIANNGIDFYSGVGAPIRQILLVVRVSNIGFQFLDNDMI